MGIRKEHCCSWSSARNLSVNTGSHGLADKSSSYWLICKWEERAKNSLKSLPVMTVLPFFPKGLQSKNNSLRAHHHHKNIQPKCRTCLPLVQPLVKARDFDFFDFSEMPLSPLIGPGYYWYFLYSPCLANSVSSSKAQNRFHAFQQEPSLMLPT